MSAAAMTPEERASILAKLQKVMRLGKSSEPNEAAAAMRQAQKMMRAYAITDAEVAGLEVKNATYVTPEPRRQSTPLYMLILVALLGKAFGVDATFESQWVGKTQRLSVRYFGPEGAPELATYTHAVIWRQLMAAWRQFVKDHPGLADRPGARSGFWIGWLEAVESKVVDFGRGPAEKEIMSKAVATHYGKALAEPKISGKKVYEQTVDAGAEAAADFSIHRPMGDDGKPQKLLG